MLAVVEKVREIERETELLLCDISDQLRINFEKNALFLAECLTAKRFTDKDYRAFYSEYYKQHGSSMRVAYEFLNSVEDIYNFCLQKGRQY